MQVLQPVAIQCAQVVGIADFFAQLFEDRDVALAGTRSVAAGEVMVQISLDPIDFLSTDYGRGLSNFRGRKQVQFTDGAKILSPCGPECIII